MSRRIGGVRLALAFASRRRAQTAVLLVLGLALSTAVVGLATTRDSAAQAITDSLRADLGHTSYALQTGNPDVIDALQDLDHVSPVQDEQGDLLTADGLAAPVLIRATSDPDLELGVLTGGERPRRAGEILVSESTAGTLGIAIGDRVRLRVSDAEEPGRVVGFVVDPADTANRTVIRLVDQRDLSATRWLADRDFYGEAALRPFLDRRTASYQSLGSLLEAAETNRPRFLSAMRFVPAGAGLLLGVVLLSVLTVMARRWRTDADMLVAAGMAPGLAWRRILSTVFGIVLVGEVLGTAAALGALTLTREAVSDWFGQHWVRVTVPWTDAATVIGLTIAAAALTLPVVRTLPLLAARFARPRRWRHWSTPVAALVGGAGAVAWVLGVTQEVSDQLALLTPVAATAVVAATPFLIAPAVCWGLPRATKALLRNLAGGLRPIAAAGAVVALLSGFWSAQTVHDANRGEAMSSPLQPAGSFVISTMPDTAIGTLVELYRSHGGEQVARYQIPDETTASLRVTSTDLVSCMSELRAPHPEALPEHCWPQDTAAPINTVMLGPAGSVPLADPGLVRDAEVGLLLFAAGDGTVSQLAVTGAQSDPTLGGNLPGLVVPSDSTVAAKFNLVASGTSEVALLDFDRLTPHEQFLMRAAAIRLAPGAQTADGTDPTAYDRLRSVANTVGALGAAAAAVLLLLGGLSILVANAATRRTLADLGPTARWRLVVRWAAVPTMTAALAIPLAILTASSAGQGTDASYGSLWLLPGCLAVLASLVIGTGFLRVPPLTAD